MSDYFDELEAGLRDAVKQRAHLPWYRRVGSMSLRHRGVVAIIAALVVATPTVAAVGEVAGWFGRGSSPIYYPASATRGLGKVLATGGRLLPIRVADPDGGPPWGIRLVRTTRGETCIQVGRVVDGQIGQLGIDTAWHDDHEFHEIKPNDQLADICGSTDSAGNGFVDQGIYGAPASVDIPLDNSSGAPNACVDPYMSPVPAVVRRGRKLEPFQKRLLRHIEQQRRADGDCPFNAMRMIFVGLLGPDARSVTYRTPSGLTRTQPTAAGTGAYLIVFRETAGDCLDFTRSLNTSPSGGCGPGNGGGPNPDLQGPSAITAVTYNDGKRCSDLPSASFAIAYQKASQASRKLSAKQARKFWAHFTAQHHLSERAFFNAVQPRCLPVGWVKPKLPKLTSADLASPIHVKLQEGKRFCTKTPDGAGFNGAVPCDKRVPKGDRYLYGSGPGVEAVLLSVSFTVRQPVTSDNSDYVELVKSPGNTGSSGNATQTNLRAGEHVTLSEFMGANPPKGTYRGTIAFVQDDGQQGRDAPALFFLSRGRHPRGTFIVGHFSFKLPLKHR
jgi:hypothetical protein